ncbi:outer membrane protein assembly factor BamB family protein [Halorientalis marina]|uniref:outer membrane protein assembly factor BamB family protein n=1 Tax=Halorientalis marina TaxID=2931976 RepID=UPI001FF5E7CE|nr:PQQ-binding-like beta-propeller repeat protein [Halorientalis marina]
MGLVVVSVACLVLVSGLASGHSVGLIYNPPAVADGELYVTSTDGHVYALDDDGAPRWTVNASGEITTPATVADDAVVFGTADGRVLALTRELGHVSWNRQLAGSRVNSVTAGENGIYAGAGSQLVALDRNGSVDWRYAADGFVGTPVVSGDRGPYVAASRIRARNGTLHALSANGSVRWTRDVNATIEQLSVDNGVVYHTADGRVTATAANGTRLWTVALEQVMAPPSVRNGTVVVGTISGTIAAIEAGEVVWRYQTDLPVAPRLVGDTVYATTPRGLHAVKGGSEQWTRTVGTTVLAPPTVGENVYLGTQVNRTYAVTHDGAFAWINQYSTTTADVPWTDDDGPTEFYNPAGTATRVVGPDGSVRPVTPDEPTRSVPMPVGGLGLALAAVVLLLAVALVVRFRRR